MCEELEVHRMLVFYHCARQRSRWFERKGAGVMPTFFVPDLFLDGISYQSSDYWRQRPPWTVASTQLMRQ
jgi:hypothetical protein